MKLPPKKTAGDPTGGITAANYLERCVAHIQANGGRGFVIRSVEGDKGSAKTSEPPTPAQWLAWVRYMRRKNIPTKFMLHHGVSTVPCEWPEDFDPDAPPSSRVAYKPPVVADDVTLVCEWWNRYAKLVGLRLVDEIAPDSYAGAAVADVADDLRQMCGSLGQGLFYLEREIRNSAYLLGHRGRFVITFDWLMANYRSVLNKTYEPHRQQEPALPADETRERIIEGFKDLAQKMAEAAAGQQPKSVAFSIAKLSPEAAEAHLAKKAEDFRSAGVELGSTTPWYRRHPDDYMPDGGPPPPGTSPREPKPKG